MYPSSSVWYREPADLVGFFEPTPVSKQLDEFIERMPARRVQAPDLAYVEGALRRFLLPVMYPKRRLFPPWWAVHGRWDIGRDGVARPVKLPDSAPYADELFDLMSTEA